MSEYDVIIVGAGPTGLACAIEAQRKGISNLLLDKGCVVNSLYHYPINMVFFTTPDLLEIGEIPFTSVRAKPTRQEALKYYRLVAQHYQVQIHQYEEVQGVGGSDGQFEIRTRTAEGDARRYQARKVVLALGYYGQPNKLGIPGEDLPKVSHYYREAHPYYQCDVAVIGGKNSAAEAALDLYRHGARVTLIHRSAQLSDSIKYWLRPDLENRIKAGAIRAFFDTRVVEIRPDCIRVAPIHATESEGTVQTIKNDFVFAMTGYHPDTEFLKRIGVEVEPRRMRPCCNPETLESNIAGLYLAGTIIAGLDTNEIFIENGRFHGRLIVADIAAKLRG